MQHLLTDVLDIVYHVIGKNTTNLQFIFVHFFADSGIFVDISPILWV